MLQVQITQSGAIAVDAPPRIGGLRRASRVLMRRRIAVAILNGATIATLAAMMAVALFSGGVSLIKVGMWLAFLVTLPWLSIGFWNAIIGTALTLRGPVPDDPLALDFNPNAVITTRTAVVMAVRNEEPARALDRLATLFDDLVAAGLAPHFDVHVLSDTNDAAIAAEEERLVARWREGSAHPEQIFYRRRTDNRGYKAGNIEEFCSRTGATYDFFLPLDADSFLSASAIARLVRIMQRHRRIGILQTLVVGVPSQSFFTRVFQFGMRHGMRAYTAGSVWWTGDCGAFWGHNALIRTRAFRDHCTLPVLPGDGPLGGYVMSHDQMEAVLMRRAGYHCRVIAEEGESWEENPPTLPDFVRRELRWCQGNMQYLKLLGLPRLKPVSRIQLVLAILMYAAPFAWMAFIFLGTASLFSEAGSFSGPMALGIALFVTIMFMTFAPKLMGLAGLLWSGEQSARYGGRGMVLLGGLVEIIVSMVIAPVVAFSVAVFAAGLAFGKKIDWRAQSRTSRAVSWREATIDFLPQTCLGLVLFGVFALSAPQVLPWAAPVILGFVLSIPFAVASASPALGRWSRARGLCAIPEDLAPPAPLATLQRRVPPL
ncbi:glucans biosynthesis glucosyltransferase MdoH [Acuticoccus kandeliae]|uniref:glucans biosynthesis glucosyltransferase MdoH n=1 Tax=Acuticoccus kandeliae TaxID=2073160 RepID=UPI000D3ED854|nr:glucans biosynthesis glucosyltransferase MdoH [Acuticoccus kandeliae]